MTAVPWLVADGYVAAYQDVLNALPLILVTSNWVRETYIRDGLKGNNIEVLPVGCDTDNFAPRDREDPKVQAIREALGTAGDGWDSLICATIFRAQFFTGENWTARESKR
jgi:hypothetical protein